MVYEHRALLNMDDVDWSLSVVDGRGKHVASVFVMKVGNGRYEPSVRRIKTALISAGWDYIGPLQRTPGVFRVTAVREEPSDAETVSRRIG